MEEKRLGVGLRLTLSAPALRELLGEEAIAEIAQKAEATIANELQRRLRAKFESIEFVDDLVKDAKARVLAGINRYDIPEPLKAILRDHADSIVAIRIDSRFERQRLEIMKEWRETADRRVSERFAMELETAKREIRLLARQEFTEVLRSVKDSIPATTP